MTEPFRVIIPARYGSTRLEGKVLKDIGGKPLIQHAYESALNSNATEVIIATDDERIIDTAKHFGARAILTSKSHQSGTDRIAETVERLALDDTSVILNVQGDEFGLAPAVISQLGRAFIENDSCSMATVCKEISDLEQYDDPDCVKVVLNEKNEAMYFSRRAIPWTGEAINLMPQSAHVHMGLYAYRADFLKTYSQWSVCPLEESERLEQLRVLYHGHKIHVEKVNEPCGMGVDNLADLERARKIAAAS